MSPNLFQQIAQAVKPATPCKSKIVDIDYQVTVDKVVVIISRGVSRAIVHSTDVHVINHDDLLPWVEENHLLEVENLRGEDAYTETIGYAEYLRDYICTSDVREYLNAKQLI